VTNPTQNEVKSVVDVNYRQLIEKADVKAVYGEPMRVGDSIVIPAAEILCISGYGYGEGEGEDPQNHLMSGGGGGGGGYAFSRPVAMVIVNEDGVQVQQVLDLTKISLAAITAFGFMFSMIASVYKMRKNI
jgi:uncharacterized spore protein YtfJ